MPTYTLSNVQANHAVTVKFKPIGFVINTSIVQDEFGEDNGIINPLGNTTVSYGSNFVLTITPNVGFELDEIRLDGSVVQPDAGDP
jgi:hypothetical protein